MKFKHYITRDINEAAYDNNLGFEEMMKFYQKATNKEIKQLESLMKQEKEESETWDEFKLLIKKVIGVTLK